MSKQGMWRKRCLVFHCESDSDSDSASDIVACFRRTWEIKAINIFTMSDVHCPSIARCPLPAAHCPLPAARCPLSADLQVAAHASKLLEFSVSARINHTPWHLSKMLSVYGLGRAALIPMPIPAPVVRARPFCRLKVHLAIVCFVTRLASLVLQAPLRLVSVRRDTSEAPPLNSYSFNCYLSWVSAIRSRKVDAHNSKTKGVLLFWVC